MRTRAEFLAEHVGVTVDQLAHDLDTASTAAQVEELVFVTLLRVGFPDLTRLPEDKPLLRRITEARSRVGLTSSESQRRTEQNAAELQMAQNRAARRATA